MEDAGGKCSRFPDKKKISSWLCYWHRWKEMTYFSNGLQYSEAQKVPVE